MTRQDILNMNTSQDIRKALAKHPQLWDEEVSNHLRDTKRKENKRRFGEADVIYTPPKQKST